MALLTSPITLFTAAKCFAKSRIGLTGSVRNLMSKQLVYGEFGDPLHVVKMREVEVPEVGNQEVLVRMLAAPVNPADINTIQGKNPSLPHLPTVPGDEGVGEVLEVGKHVRRFVPKDRVVLSSRLLGSWRYYGIYNEKDVHLVSKNLPLAEAAMLTIAPCTATRLLTDFRKMCPGETVIQNAANSACGQSVIQLCRAEGINTLNIVANHCGYEAVKAYLLGLGATAVYTLEEAEELTSFDTSLARPALALNCLGGRFEDVMLRLLDRNGVIVYYGCAFDLPTKKQFLRCDAQFHKFNLHHWEAQATSVDKDIMYKTIIRKMVEKKFNAPAHQPVEMKNYLCAFKNTVHSEAFSTMSYVFDFTL